MSNITRFLLTVFITYIASISSSSFGMTYNYPAPVADTFVKYANNTTNYGSNTTTQIRRAGNTTYSRLTYIKFDLNVAPLDSMVSSATLNLRLSNINSNRSSAVIEVFGMDPSFQGGTNMLGQDWGESNLKNSNAPWKAQSSATIPSHMIYLGSFSLPATGGASSGTIFSISTPALASFIEDSLFSSANHNNLLTFIIRDKDKEANLASFTTKEHSTIEPASLSVTIEPVVLKKANGTLINHPSIQSALNAAYAGDTVVLGDEIFHENVKFKRSGTSSSRIVLTAAPGASPIIDGAKPELQNTGNGLWTIHNSAKGIYKATVPYDDADTARSVCTYVSRFNNTGEHGCDKLLNAYASLGALDNVVRGEGSYRSNQTVYIRLDGNANPNNVGLSVGQARGVADTGGFSHITISNIEVRNGGWSGICMSGSSFSNITVENITARNNFRGITITEGESGNGLLVRDCGIFNGYNRAWTRSDAYTSGIGAYAPQSNNNQRSPFRGTGIRIDGENIEVDNCKISGNWDGIVAKGINMNLHHNTIHHIHDDAVELESSRSENVEFYNNHIYDAYVGISVTPSEPGPFYIYRNLVEATRTDPGYLSGSSDDRNGYSLKSGTNKNDLAQDVKIYHNTFYANSANVWEKVGDAQPDDWDGYDFINNIFYARGTQNVLFRGLGGSGNEGSSGPDNVWSSNFYNIDAPGSGEEYQSITSTNSSQFFQEIPSSGDIGPNNLRLIPGSSGYGTGSAYPNNQGWPDTVTSFPYGRDRGAWESQLPNDFLGSNW